MLNKVPLLVVLATVTLIFFAPAAVQAQLVGTDSAPGDSCAGFPAGTARVNASPAGDGSHITLICDGSEWQAAGGGGDNLGNHTATQALDMDGFAINNAGAVTATSYSGDGSGLSGVVTAETDPTISTLTSGKWCATNGSVITCTEDAPGGGDDLGDHTATQALDMDGFAINNAGAVTATSFSGDGSGLSGVVTTETDPTIGALTNGRWCTTDGNTVTCTQTVPVLTEVDPTISTLTSGKWCTTNGSVIACTEDAPGGGDDLGNHTATTNINLGANYISRAGTAAGLSLDASNNATFSGDIRFTGVITDISDIRLKEDVRPLQSSLMKLTTLDGLSYRMKSDDKGRVEYGFSAQEVKRVFPDLVLTDDDAMGTMSVNYIGLIAPMIEAIKELKGENEKLRARIETLERHPAARNE